MTGSLTLPAQRLGFPGLPGKCHLPIPYRVPAGSAPGHHPEDHLMKKNRVAGTHA